MCDTACLCDAVCVTLRVCVCTRSLVTLDVVLSVPHVYLFVCVCTCRSSLPLCHVNEHIMTNASSILAQVPPAVVLIVLALVSFCEAFVRQSLSGDGFELFETTKTFEFTNASEFLQEMTNAVGDAGT